MSVKFTPGPWKQGKINPERVSVRGFWVCDCDPTHSNYPVCEANARLIAAAPDLLAAAKLADKMIIGMMNAATGDHGEDFMANDDEFQLLRAAIAKAEDMP